MAVVDLSALVCDCPIPLYPDQQSVTHVTLPVLIDLPRARDGYNQFIRHKCHAVAVKRIRAFDAAIARRTIMC
jgi:hypothetical protein